MSFPHNNALAALMSSPNRGVVRKRADQDDNKKNSVPRAARPEEEEEALEDDEEEEEEKVDIKYLGLLKRSSREQFKRKFDPIIKPNGNYSKLGGYPDNPCWLITGYAKQGKGRPRASYQVYIQGRSERVTISGARAAVIFAMIRALEASGGQGDIEWPYPANFEASHLCHQANCIRPDHIVMESKVDNLSRNGCPGVVFCPACPIILNGCAHSPPCIRSNWAITCNSCGKGMEQEEGKSQAD